MPRFTQRKRLLSAIALIALSGADLALASGHGGAVFSNIVEVPVPVGSGAQDPSLFATESGKILMSWTEPSEDGHAVRIAGWIDERWTAPMTVTASDQLFVNWADIPSVAAFSDSTLAVHWLQDNGRTAYAYDFTVALSDDGGETWGDAQTPHRDGRSVQHGFATLLPVAADQLMAIWLDGRQYGLADFDDESGGNPDEMQLRAAMIGSDGVIGEEMLIDPRACTCCQTSAAVAGDGSILLVYRDRTAEEIRDISIVRYDEGEWSAPMNVHEDGWQISGCPVNGPAIDAEGELVVVAWFTAPDDSPAVYVSFSEDTGVSFGDAFSIGGEDVAGRVDVLMLDDGAALVSWVEWTGDGEALIVCLAESGQGCGATQQVHLNSTTGSINFPRMVSGPSGVYFAWTQPGERGADGQMQADTIMMVLAQR
ncbi:sialidase family protein [Gymnodinialimonas ceratoperidinii]|uniref:Glycoside hydrolase n=1 Tax=Gymnodinialimonas ceratoperidinii TaxID=2856823 RepID=A0A8F6TYX6_9RHOB|nr:sialidase family protein [Gymnodinialimonas ceratoperidinii]QXT41008.1 glycoside hydrolase [Gymnodinialimonas ceratoperidinii]